MTQKGSKVERLLLIIMDQGEAYHELAKIATMNQEHLSSSFTCCTESTCRALVELLDDLGVAIEPVSSTVSFVNHKGLIN
jgi:hypothetical protein